MPSPPEDESSSDGGGVKISIREWELNETSTTYDRLVAAPSDTTMESQWILFLSILVLSLTWILFVFTSMLKDKKCRQNSFNTYILFLMGPDILFNLCCTVSCALNLSLGRYISVNGCIFQSLYSVFAITSSAWINAIVLYQLHTMLWCSRKAIRYHPPTRKQVVQQCTFVYVYSIFIATWSNWVQDDNESSWWPIRNNVYSGVFCLPMPYDRDSTLFFYLLYAPLVFLLPFLYICYVFVDMINNKLLPHRRDHRKTLMVLLRLLLVYFVMWVPALGLVFVGGKFLSAWWVATGGAWAHLQGAVSAAICWFKPDIRMACQKLMVNSCCCCLHIQSIHTKKRKDSTATTTDPTTSHSSSREETAVIILDGEDDDDYNDDDIEYQNQKSCELFLGLAEVDSAAAAKRKGKVARRGSCPTAASSRKGARVGRGGAVRRHSSIELAMGLERGELSSLYTIQSVGMEKEES